MLRLTAKPCQARFNRHFPFGHWTQSCSAWAFMWGLATAPQFSSLTAPRWDAVGFAVYQSVVESSGSVLVDLSGLLGTYVFRTSRWTLSWPRPWSERTSFPLDSWFSRRRLCIHNSRQRQWEVQSQPSSSAAGLGESIHLFSGCSLQELGSAILQMVGRSTGMCQISAVLRAYLGSAPVL